MPSPTASTAARIALPAVGEGDGVLIVLNADAGTSVLKLDPRPTLRERLPRAVLHELGPDDDLAAAVRAAMAASDPPAVLGVVGGDGSVSRMAQLAIEFDRPLLALPGGTFNHFLRAAGVAEPDAAIDAAAAGTGIAASVAELQTPEATTIVLNVVSLGVYPQFVAERARHRDRLGKWIGGAASWLRTLRRAESVTVVIDGRRRRVWSVFIGVGRHRTDRIAILQRDALTGDELDVRVVLARTSRLRAMASLGFGRTTAALTRGLWPARRDLERIVAPAIELEWDASAPGGTFFVHDGELQRRPPADHGRVRMGCRALPAALRLYAP